MDRNKLFRELYRRCCNEFIEFRAILVGKKTVKVFFSLDTGLDIIRYKVDQFCKDYKDRNIYFGVATRDGEGGKKKNVVSIPCVWAEIDFKDIPESRAQEIIDKVIFKPTIITNTGRGVHLYFLLDKPVDLKRSAEVQKVNDWIRLELNKLGGCKFDKISDIPRILRLPGTVNHKYPHKPICEIVEINDNAYKLDDLVRNIPEPVTKETKKDDTYKPTVLPTSQSGSVLEAQVEYVVKQVEEKKTSLGDDSYSDWLKVAFALNAGLGETGRPYFHRVSSVSNKHDYDKEVCDRQYDACLNGDKPVDNITIGTFFHYAIEAGLKINNQKIITDNPYSINCDGCLYMYKRKRNSNGLVKQKLANFNAEIISEITKDNGVDQTINYNIEGRLRNTNLPQVEVLAEKFASMNWIHNWGTRAIIEPMSSTKDYVRHYIQSNSNATREICFTHTGWRQIDNKWVYLTGNGAIGADNVSVELSRELQKYNLPLEVIGKEKETESIMTGLSFLDIGKKEITYPLFSMTHLAPLTTILNPMPNFSTYFLGGTGLFKTTTSGLCLSFFGDFGSVSTLPNFSDTANSIERRSFILKDTLMVLDDYHPSAQKAEALKTESTAQRVIRAYSNRTGRGRLNADSTDKGRYEPRGMLLITGEDLVTLQSTLARVMVVEVNKGDIYKDKLTEIQGKLDYLPFSMASYISWVRDNINTIRNEFPKRFSSLRADACREGMHTKLPEQVAFLAFSIETVCAWLIAKNVIGEKRAKEIFKESWSVFINQALLQSRRINNENPVQKFIDILQTLITQGKVKLEHKDMIAKHLNAEKFEGLGGDQGEMIGYVDDQYCYLLPTAMWRTIQLFCRDEGGHFPVTKNALYKMLNNQGLIKQGKDGENTIAIKTDGKTCRVLALSKEAIS